VEAILAEDLDRLDRFGLRRFFEPVERRVSLSTHAGMMDRPVYELAHPDAGLIAACRDLGVRHCSSAPTSPIGRNSLC
jgi:hypothetical protein